MRISDWSSDVCSSDLGRIGTHRAVAAERELLRRVEVAIGELRADADEQAQALAQGLQPRYLHGQLVEVAGGAAAEDALVDGLGGGIAQLQAAVVQRAGGTPVAAATETVATLPGPAHAEAVAALVGLEVHDPKLIGQVLAVGEAAQEQVVAALADQRISQRPVVDVCGAARTQ